LQSGFSDNDVLPEDSFVLAFEKIEEKYFEGFNFQLFVVFKTFDYSNPELQDEMMRITTNVRNSGLISQPISFWFENYLQWLQTSYHNTSLTDKGRPPNEQTFYLWLYEFLTIPDVGMQHLNDIVFQFGAIKTSKFSTSHIFFPDDLARADALVQMRKITSSSLTPAFAYCWRYVFWEQYVGLVRTNLFNLFLVLLSIFLTILVFMGSLRLALLTLAGIMIVDIDLLGMMYLWGIGLSNLSIVNLLLSLGLAVDACVHLIHVAVTNKTAKSSREKVIQALGNVGGSVLSASLTSYIGVLILGIATHKVLRIFFKFFFSVFLLSMFQGLAVIPACLSMMKI
jgi:hypothetical protein